MPAPGACYASPAVGATGDEPKASARFRSNPIDAGGDQTQMMSGEEERAPGRSGQGRSRGSAPFRPDDALDQEQGDRRAVIRAGMRHLTG